MNWKETLERVFATGPSHEPNPLQRAALSALLLTAVMGSVVLVLAVGRWFDVSTPSWLLLASSLPTAAVATLMATSHEEKLSPARLLAPMGVSLGVALSLGVAMGLLWREDSIRQSAIAWADERQITPVLLGAMQTDDPDIGVMACKRLVGSQSEDVRREAFDALLERPLHFSACLEDSPLQEDWGKRLVDGWMSSLKAEQEPDRICAWSQTLSEATREVPGAGVALLSCALDDASAPHRTCCMRALKAGNWMGDRLAERLEQARPHAIYEQAMATELTAHLAGEASADIGVQQSEGMARYAFASACRSLDLEQEAIASGFASVAIAKCTIREKSLRQDTAFWVSVCGVLEQDIARQPDKPIQKLFCKETRGRMVERASFQASGLVHKAMLNRYTKDHIKLRKLAGVIHSAATQSGFVPDDSTGIVSDYESSRYDRSASNQALHKIGERHIKRKSQKFEHNESLEARKLRDRSVEALDAQEKHLTDQQRIEIYNKELDALLNSGGTR